MDGLAVGGHGQEGTVDLTCTHADVSYERAQEAPTSFTTVPVPSRPRPPAASPSTCVFDSPPALHWVEDSPERSTPQGYGTRTASRRKRRNGFPPGSTPLAVFDRPEARASVDIDDP